jgi:hypothetical protein
VISLSSFRKIQGEYVDQAFGRDMAPGIEIRYERDGLAFEAR